MKHILSAIALLFALSVTSASAATVLSGTTKIGDTNNITLAGAGTAQATTPPSNVATIANADWVWGSGGVGSTATFEFAFDLTGYNPLNASLTGRVAVDNFVTIFLNGTEIFSLPNLFASNYQTLNAFSTSNGALFTAGANVLRFVARDSWGLRGMTAEVSVSAAPVPLPAGLPLLLAGLGGLVLMRRRSAAK